MLRRSQTGGKGIFVQKAASVPVEATVVAELPQRLFRLQFSDGTVVVAGPSQAMGRLARPIRIGARVTVRRAEHDPGRGTITAVIE